MLVRKASLRAALEMETRAIAEVLPALNAVEVEQLQAMLASEVTAIDADAEAQVAQEAALARTTKAMNVQLSRAASLALQNEMMCRLEQGRCAAPAALVGEAVAKAFAGGRP